MRVNQINKQFFPRFVQYFLYCFHLHISINVCLAAYLANLTTSLLEIFDFQWNHNFGITENVAEMFWVLAYANRSSTAVNETVLETSEHLNISYGSTQHIAVRVKFDGISPKGSLELFKRYRTFSRRLSLVMVHTNSKQ